MTHTGVTCPSWEAEDMFKGLTHDVKIVVISVAVSSLVVGVPAAAAVYANNSDKVDGKHAIGAAASSETRAGKLVATNKNGFLPNNIIQQAMDSALLDGMDSTDFTRGGGTTRATVVTAAANTWTYRTVTTGAGGFGGTWVFRCPVDPTTTAAQLQFFSGDATDVYVSRLGSTGTWFQSVPAGDWMFIRDAAPVGGNNGDIFSWTFVNATKNLVVTAQTTSRRTETGCTFTSQATETPAS